MYRLNMYVCGWSVAVQSNTETGCYYVWFRSPGLKSAKLLSKSVLKFGHLRSSPYFPLADEGAQAKLGHFGPHPCVRVLGASRSSRTMNFKVMPCWIW